MNVVYQMDCMEYMKSLPDKIFDLAIVDPPYFSGPEKRGYYGRSVSATRVKRVEYPKAKSAWNVPGQEYFQELLRISRNQIVWGCNYYDFRFGRGRIIWDKVNGASSFSDCEIAYCSLHDSVRIFRYLWNGMMQGSSIEHGEIQQGNKTLNEKRIHPTQKPVALYKWLLQKYAKPGDRIFDSHVGSGSSRIACHDMGFEFVGCEIDKDYWEGQEERFQQHVSQMELFDGNEIQKGIYGGRCE